MSDESRQKLELFVSRVQKVQGYGFVQRILNQEGLSFTFNCTLGQDSTLDTNHPSSEEVDAVTLTARMFIQNNDQVSFGNMSKLTKDPGISDGWKYWFARIRTELNEFLEAGAGFQINDVEFSHREIFNAFLYGELAHSDPKEIARLEGWKPNPIVYVMVQQHFHETLFNVIDSAKRVSDLSMAELSSEDIDVPQSHR